MKFKLFLGLMAMACFSFSHAEAQERPVCPSAQTEEGWIWHYDEDHLWVHQSASVAVWTLPNGETVQMKGLTLGYYWAQPFSSNASSYQLDGDRMLQNSLYIPVPEQQSGTLTIFGRKETDPKHDYYVSLSVDGQEITPISMFSWTWNPKTTKSIFVSDSKLPAAQMIRKAFETGEGELSVQVWAKSKDQPSREKQKMGSAVLTLQPLGDLPARLSPKVEQEMARAKASGVYCEEPKF